MDNIPLIVHSCDLYSNCWPIWFFFYKKYVSGFKTVYFLTEEKDLPFSSQEIILIKTGKGQWGERLIKALTIIPFEFVFYMQEDYWAKKNFNPASYNTIKEKYKFDALRITKKISSMGFKFDKINSNLYKYTKESSYLMNHRFSLWKKNFFLKYIDNNDTPWKNEINQTKKIRKNNFNIYHIDDDWYDPCVKKGKLRDYGRKLIIEHRAEFLEFYSLENLHIKNLYIDLCDGKIESLI
jgi:hypothetical protein